MLTTYRHLYCCQEQKLSTENTELSEARHFCRANFSNSDTTCNMKKVNSNIYAKLRRQIGISHHYEHLH